MHLQIFDGTQLRKGARFAKVTLSRRNVLALMHKLDKVDSARTLEKVMDNGDVISVYVEEDIEHLKRTGLPPGRMTPDTESYIGARARGSE